MGSVASAVVKLVSCRQIKETSIRSKRIASDAATSSTLRVTEKIMPAERRYEPDNASTTQGTQTIGDELLKA